MYDIWTYIHVWFFFVSFHGKYTVPISSSFFPTNKPWQRGFHPLIFEDISLQNHGFLQDKVAGQEILRCQTFEQKDRPVGHPNNVVYLRESPPKMPEQFRFWAIFW